MNQIIYVWQAVMIGLACVLLALGLRSLWHPTKEEKAQDDFLAAAIALWRNVDENSAVPDTQEGRVQLCRINIHFREAWHKYREFLPGDGHESADSVAPLP